MPLSDQVEMFKEYIVKLKALVGEENTTHILGNSIFLVVAGSNDIANTYFTLKIRSFQYDILSYADLLVSSASDFIQVFKISYIKKLFSDYIFIVGYMSMNFNLITILEFLISLINQGNL